MWHTGLPPYQILIENIGKTKKLMLKIYQLKLLTVSFSLQMWEILQIVPKYKEAPGEIIRKLLTGLRSRVSCQLPPPVMADLGLTPQHTI